MLAHQQRAPVLSSYRAKLASIFLIIKNLTQNTATGSKPEAAHTHTHSGSVCQQGSAASSLPQQLLGVVSILLLIILVVVLMNTKGLKCSYWNVRSDRFRKYCWSQSAAVDELQLHRRVMATRWQQLSFGLMNFTSGQIREEQGWEKVKKGLKRSEFSVRME